MSDLTAPTNPMIVNLDRFTRMRNHFMKHYFLSNCNPNFGGQEIQVPWNSFSLAIKGFITTFSAAPKTVAIRFVHCYDATQNVLYLRMQILTMTPIQGHPRKFALVTTSCAWYELSNGTITPTKNTDLFDTPYLTNFYYCNAHVCTPTTLQQLADDTMDEMYARTVVLPWFELAELYTDNDSPSNATLCIDAASRLTIVDPEVKYQHGLVCYLRKHDGTPLLDNEEAELPFTNKAADFGTMCPPTCDIYKLPKERMAE